MVEAQKCLSSFTPPGNRQGLSGSPPGAAGRPRTAQHRGQDNRHHQQLWDQQALGMAQQCSKGALGQTSRWHQTGHKVTPGVLVGMVLAARLLGLSIHLRLRCLCSPASML